MSISLTFQVKQHHIDQAIQSNSCFCMVAEALKEKCPDARFVNVDLKTIRFTRLKLGKRYVFETPEAVSERIIAFDAGDLRKLKPFEVRLYHGRSFPMQHQEGGLPKSHYQKTREGKGLRDRIFKVIQDHPGITRTSLRRDVLGGVVTGQQVDKAIKGLIEEDLIQSRTHPVGINLAELAECYYPIQPQERLTTSNIRNSRFRRFGVRALRANQSEPEPQE